MENILSFSDLFGGNILDLSCLTLTIKKTNIIINAIYNFDIKIRIIVLNFKIVFC